MTDSRPRVDVGIVTWNTRDLTVEAIGRLRAASPDVDLQVLLRDNGSTDGTAEAVRAQHPDVAVEVGDNVGFAAGVNRLLARSEAPWFVTLNSDAWPEPGALRRLVELAQQQPRAAAVAPLLLRPDGALEHSTHPLPSLAVAAAAGLGAGRLLGRRAASRLCLPGAWQHDVVRQVGWAVGAALLLRREAVQQVGPFDASLFMYAEDLDWCWRARRAGWEVWFTPAAVVRHVGNASGAQRYGTEREQVAITNANAVVGRFRGPAATATWRGLNAVGAVRGAARARLSGDTDLASYWWRQLPAHLSRRR
jgi:GT2 family glycosyltransferase